MKIALVAKKGGVGKSTICLMLYEAFRQISMSVAVLDWDAQGTSNKALRLLEGTAAKPSELYQILLNDTPPSLAHTATLSAVREADIVLIPSTPSPADLWEAEEASRFALEKNPGATVRLVLNKVRPRTVLSRAMNDYIKHISAPPLTKALSSRECYQHAVMEGWNGLDGAAQLECAQLASEVLGLTAERKRKVA